MCGFSMTLNVTYVSIRPPDALISEYKLTGGENKLCQHILIMHSHSGPAKMRKETKLVRLDENYLCRQSKQGRVEWRVFSGCKVFDRHKDELAWCFGFPNSSNADALGGVSRHPKVSIFDELGLKNEQDNSEDEERWALCYFIDACCSDAVVWSCVSQMLNLWRCLSSAVHDSPDFPKMLDMFMYVFTYCTYLQCRVHIVTRTLTQSVWFKFSRGTTSWTQTFF